MNHWDEIREHARQMHAKVRSYGEPSAEISAQDLLCKTEQMTGVKRVPLAADNPLLNGAAAMLAHETIWYNEDVEPWLALYYQAHEYVHFWLHNGERSCLGADINIDVSEEDIPLGVNRVEGYGPHERREREANIFAREFLLPGNVLQRWFTEENMNAAVIATKTGISIEMVFHQLGHALLVPEVPSSAEKYEVEILDLDSSQKSAAHTLTGPLLIEAGPGTGKTRTLIGRILYLIDQGISPSTILALTFSNRAAGEMRERVAVASPATAPLIWMGTFHAFGLELLRKYGTRIGLPPKPDVIDPVDALILLERAIPELGLDHYANLYEPTTYLKDILNAISRAKDEMVDPIGYTNLAQAMLSSATTDNERKAAEKALEVARVYRFYQEFLNQNHLLDLGDLIFRSVTLLKQNPDVRAEVQQTYSQILVDEYQDVNRVSGLLLRELAGTAEGLWAVGDARQAIYRWRGASTINMSLFCEDFPNAKILQLGVNYRSQPAIVETFSALAPRMRATHGKAFIPWGTHRIDAGGKVLFEIASDETAEAKGIVQEIERQRAKGAQYRNQAVICRSNTSLARFAAALEEEGVPVLYLGDIFERSEVRDLLSLLALACESNGHGLVRVARIPEYQIPLVDVQALFDLASEQNVPFPRALKLAANTDKISPMGKEKIALLAEHINGLCYGISGWKMLTRYLFERSCYLRLILSDNSVVGQQKRLAVYQFLQFVHSQLGLLTDKEIDPKLALLKYIKRLEIFGEEKQLRQAPTWADNINAVRVLTVHASKGLEFNIVYLPKLGGAYFPVKRQPQHCPPPVDLIEGGLGDWHDEEEECLFFVALSRARDSLCISRSQRYGASTSKASKLLLNIANHLPRAIDGPVTWLNGKNYKSEPSFVPCVPVSELELAPPYKVRQLETYMRCPRQYYYEFVFGLSGKREDSAYEKFHLCVSKVLRWIQSERATLSEVNEANAQKYLTEIWEVNGPKDHAYEAIYLDQAKLMITRSLTRPILANRRETFSDCEINLKNGTVVLTPDHIELSEDGTNSFLLLQRIRTGRPTKSEEEKPIYGLYHAAATKAHPKGKSRVQIFYLSTNEIKDVELTSNQISKRLEDYDKAIAGILQKQFSPNPSDRDCPRCPYYFICPVAEDV